ncbi:hypothetical protein MGSAQ_002711 [marine sediment metagenome]|uniref:Uncharacterized protein n=1 Tax=marine sediment metagenome TaxID=412755 RepID=A0A1B6NQS8_9ZZZZ
MLSLVMRECFILCSVFLRDINDVCLSYFNDNLLMFYI